MRPVPGRDLEEACGLLAAVWTVLALGGAASPLLGRSTALIASFGLATGLCGVDVLARRATSGRGPAHGRGSGRQRPRRCRCRSEQSCQGLGPAPAGLRVLVRSAWLGALGFALAPGVIAAAMVGGALLDMSTSRVIEPPASAPSTTIALCLAPFFEEHLYRGRILPALLPWTGRIIAVLLSSALFALPHLELHAIVGAWLAGLLMGGVKLRTGRTVDCVALHAGMNLAGLTLSGALPFELPTPHPSWSVPAALLLCLGPRGRAGAARRAAAGYLARSQPTGLPIASSIDARTSR